MLAGLYYVCGAYWALLAFLALRLAVHKMEVNNQQSINQTGNKPRRRKLVGITPITVLPRLLIASEVAEAVRKSEKTVYKWAAAGTIPSINLHGNVLFDREEIIAWINGHRMAA
jgi:excisionase family DNA binding protein